MSNVELSIHERTQGADLLREAGSVARREEVIFSSAQQDDVEPAWSAELTPEKAHELDRIIREIAASERALRDGSIPVEQAALWHADWVAEKVLFEAELKRTLPLDRLRRIEAHTDSGIYRGPTVGETARHVLQELPGRGVVAHRKKDLERSPAAGENVTVRYSNGRARVYDAPARSSPKDLGRQR